MSVTDICTRCGTTVVVVSPKTTPDGTAWICEQCGKQTDFVWNEDQDLVDEIDYYDQGDCGDR